jgi:hypothetical protein
VEAVVAEAVQGKRLLLDLVLVGLVQRHYVTN